MNEEEKKMLEELRKKEEMEKKEKALTVQTDSTGLTFEPIEPKTMLEVMTTGNCAGLSDGQKMAYFKMQCDSVGVNPASVPFIFIPGKSIYNKKTKQYESTEKLYPTATLADQLGVSNIITFNEEPKITTDKKAYTVTVKMKGTNQRTGCSRWREVTLALFHMDKEGNKIYMKGQQIYDQIAKCQTKCERQIILKLSGISSSLSSDVMELAPPPPPPARVMTEKEMFGKFEDEPKQIETSPDPEVLTPKEKFDLDTIENAKEEKVQDAKFEEPPSPKNEEAEILRKEALKRFHVTLKDVNMSYDKNKKEVLYYVNAVLERKEKVTSLTQLVPSDFDVLCDCLTQGR